ncbi:hypothetical protein N8766_06690, partial [bacterium]|nr:hypothetical protein [bacterium]
SRKDVVTVPFQSVTTRMPPKDSEAEKKSDVKETPTKMSKEDRKKANKPIEVVFVVEEGKAKMVPVERGISDDNYFEITSGVEAGQSIVSGSYKAIAEDLEDGMKVKLNSGDTNLDDSKEDEKP